MGEICHNCKSEFTFFDGEVYQCLRCSYMWVPETTAKSSNRLSVEDRAKIKKEFQNKNTKEIKQI